MSAATAHKPLIAALLSEAPVLTDGAWGTELQALGLPLGEIPDSWNLSHPEAVKSVAQSYVGAGSRIILTNTFRSNRITMPTAPGDNRVRRLNKAGVQLSIEAAGDTAHVFASIGPSGKLIVTGEVTESDLKDAFREQVEAQVLAGAEGLVIETMSDLAEARIAACAAVETGLPVVACMVFDSGKNRDRTMMGVTPEQAAQELSALGVDVIGANCGSGIADYVSVCERLGSSTPLPIWIKPNAGLPVVEGGRVVYRTTPEEFAGCVPDLIAAGATFVGGCCGTDPSFMRAVKRLIHPE